MLAVGPLLDPRVWVEAFQNVPAAWRLSVLALLGLFILLRWWLGRKKNGD
jgi:hypothetical protein